MNLKKVLSSWVLSTKNDSVVLFWSINEQLFPVNGKKETEGKKRLQSFPEILDLGKPADD